LIALLEMVAPWTGAPIPLALLTVAVLELRALHRAYARLAQRVQVLEVGHLGDDAQHATLGRTIRSHWPHVRAVEAPREHHQ
jgi:hypothetical protein